MPQAIGIQFETRQYVTVGFGSYAGYPAATQPGSVATADFNGDMKLDLAVAMTGSSNLNVYLGTGSGTFGSPMSFPIGGNALMVVVGDFNGDKKLDLVTGNNTANNVGVLLGDGTGRFGAATNFPAGNAYAVVVGDFNLDQKLDIVATDPSSNSVNVLLGDGTGHFGAATNVAAGVDCQGLAAGDLNGDGYPDLVTANTAFAGASNVSVLLGNGIGGFGAATNYPTGLNARIVQIADMNGDSLPDLVVANYGSNNVSVLVGNGVGGFGPAINFAADSMSSSIAVGDFNRDSVPDMAVTAQAADKIDVFLSNANPAPKSSSQALAIYNNLPTVVMGYGKGKTSNLATYSNQTTAMGVGTQVAYRIKVGITVAANQVGTWGFRVGPDFGYGGTILVDGVEVVSKWTGLNWNHSFTDPSQNLTGQVNLSLGLHVLEVYGFSSCCDRPQSVQFTAPGISSLWTPVNNVAINTCG